MFMFLRGPRMALALFAAVLVLTLSACGAPQRSAEKIPGGAAKPAPVKIRVGNTSTVADPQLSWITVGMNPKLHYYADDGVEVEIVNVGGTTQALQALATGQLDVAPVSAPGFLELKAKDTNFPGIAVYSWLREPYWSIAVPPSSPIKDLKDLRGKVIGMRNQSDTGYIGARGMLRDIGLNPDKGVEWLAVGNGAPAGEALKSGKIAALAFWDGEFARLQSLGFDMRMLPNSDLMSEMPGSSMVASQKFLEQNGDALARVLRGMAKGTAFTIANPEAAVKLHWEVYPESKPKGLTDKEAMADSLAVLAARRTKLDPGGRKDPRFGAMTAAEWQNATRFFQTADKLADVSKLYTNQLIDAINKFDVSQVRAQAKQFN